MVDTVEAAVVTVAAVAGMEVVATEAAVMAAVVTEEVGTVAGVVVADTVVKLEHGH